jgi:hypothetical protein
MVALNAKIIIMEDIIEIVYEKILRAGGNGGF